MVPNYLILKFLRGSIPEFEIPKNFNESCRLQRNILNWVIRLKDLHKLKFSPYFEEAIEIKVNGYHIFKK